MITIMQIALGGALGSVLRYLTTACATKLFGLGFPVGTLTVNILGSFLMGVLVAVLARVLPEQQYEWRLFLAVGVLGGFTTFSAFSLDVVTLIQNQQHAQAAFYVLASVLLSVAALMLGLWLVR
jgi:CrcB protein